MNNLKRIEYSLKKRKRQESRFKIYGLLGITTAVTFLCIILSSIFMEGKKAFLSTYIKLEVYFDPDIIYTDNDQKEEDIKFANFQKIIKNSLNSFFPEISDKGELRKLSNFISSSEEENLMRLVLENKQLIGQKVTLWLLASSKIDVINKNPDMELIAEEDRLISNLELNWLNEIRSANNIESNFNKNFFVKADSTEPEQAGIWGSLVGSFFTLFVTLILSFPIAVAAGVFLEELAPKNKFTDFIEVNINNLAAVPSIIFGLLGLAIFLNVMHLPRSAPIVGGMVLALMTLPTIIIATRASLKAVPPSIREAAIGLGATKFQTVTHHVLPLSLPGILTGTIIGMSQALGESAPLLMIGMVAFIVDVPGSFLDSSTVLPVQIYLWKSTAARGFVELTAAGVMVLLSFLILMNGLAVYIRQKFEKKW
jgi:phosphate transport system permease protein